MITELSGLGVVRIRADNPGPLTLSGSNSWRLAGWVVDPGPDDPAHLDAIAAAGPVEGIALTHSHPDHAAGLAGLLERVGEVPVLRFGHPVDSPFEVLPVPGHADDHLVFLWEGVCCAGDVVLGEGSVFVAGDLAGYLDGLRALRARSLRAICPGHGDPVLDPAAKLDAYLAHRLERERRLVAALERGARGDEALLDAAWDDVAAYLRPAAALTMHAHLRKLAGEGRLPADVAAPPPPPELPHV
jgi:glyoxylase-like metal-dependent hydrolase (beta-lactamase superfamily II)